MILTNSTIVATIDKILDQTEKSILSDISSELSNSYQKLDDSVSKLEAEYDKIIADGGSVILMSHLGRPKGKEEKYSLKHIVDKVSEILGVQVKFATDCVGEIAEKAVLNSLQATAVAAGTK